MCTITQRMLNADLVYTIPTQPRALLATEAPSGLSANRHRCRHIVSVDFLPFLVGYL